MWCDDDVEWKGSDGDDSANIARDEGCANATRDKERERASGRRNSIESRRSRHCPVLASVRERSSHEQKGRWRW